MSADFEVMDESWRASSENLGLYRRIFEAIHAVDFSHTNINVEVGVIPLETIGAYVVQKGPLSYQLAINRGCAPKIAEFVFSFLNEEIEHKLLQNFSTCESEVLKVCENHSGDRSIEDVRKFLLADSILNDCLYFLIFHELCHIFFKHLEVKRPVARKARAAQNRNSEISADIKAFGIMADYISAYSIRHNDTPQDADLYAKEWYFRLGVAVSILFDLFYREMSSTDKSIEWYPPPYVRMHILFAMLIYFPAHQNVDALGPRDMFYAMAGGFMSCGAYFKKRGDFVEVSIDKIITAIFDEWQVFETELGYTRKIPQVPSIFLFPLNMLPETRRTMLEKVILYGQFERFRKKYGYCFACIYIFFRTLIVIASEPVFRIPK